jgi:hypothetical protein
MDIFENAIIIAVKCIKFFGLNVIEDVQDFYNKNYKTLLRETFKK